MKNNHKKVIFIFGANSDLGYEIIKLHIREDITSNLFLFSRNIKRLNDLKKIKPDNLNIFSIDMNKREEVIKLLNNIQINPNIIYFFNGKLDDFDIVQTDNDSIDEIINSNFLSIVNVINYYIKSSLKNDKKIKIICTSSIAGTRGKGNNIIYSASKSALTTYLSSIRQKYSNKNISIVTLIPGYIKSKMTSGLNISRLLTDDPRKLAKKIFNIMKNQDDIFIPLKWRIIVWIINLIPESIFKKLKF